MATEVKALPSIKVPSTGYDLVRTYAFNHDISRSEAVRRLLKNSPELQEIAKSDDLSEYFTVGTWGRLKDNG